MVEDLARRFEVSAADHSQDLNDLCDHRSLTRIHGGHHSVRVENLAYEARGSSLPKKRKPLVCRAALIPMVCVHSSSAHRRGGERADCMRTCW